MPKPKRLTQEQLDARYWRYKKSSVPVDEFAHLNGPVITRIPKLEPETTQDTRTTPTSEESTSPMHGIVRTSLPHPFKCNKCDYTAETAANSRQHWFDEHKG